MVRRGAINVRVCPRPGDLVLGDAVSLLLSAEVNGPQNTHICLLG